MGRHPIFVHSKKQELCVMNIVSTVPATFRKLVPTSEVKGKRSGPFGVHGSWVRKRRNGDLCGLSDNMQRHRCLWPMNATWNNEPPAVSQEHLLVSEGGPAGTGRLSAPAAGEGSRWPCSTCRANQALSRWIRGTSRDSCQLDKDARGVYSGRCGGCVKSIKQASRQV